MHLKRHSMRRRCPGPPAPGRSGAEMQDLLSSVSERTDLERLFDRKVSLPQILRLAGRGIDHDRIAELLRSSDPSGDLRRLLDS